jgi:hypothetical protein
MGCTACTEPQCLYKGDLYLHLLLHGEKRGEISVTRTFKRNLGVWNRSWLTVVLNEVKTAEKDGR